MDNFSVRLQVLLVVAGVVVAIAFALAPFFWISRYILAPIDRAAKSRKAPVRFSIGDFLCLFLAIQIPLAVVHRFMSPDTMEAYWGFTVITWLVAPMIWSVGARRLSKAQITKGSHRFIFLGLIMPLVYYGLIPFTALGFTFLAAFFGEAQPSFGSLAAAWFVLAALFFISSRYVQWMVKQVPADALPGSDEERGHQLFRPALLDTSVVGDSPAARCSLPAKTA